MSRRYITYLGLSMVIFVVLSILLVRYARNPESLLVKSVVAPTATSTPGHWYAFQKPTESELRARLTQLQFDVTQQDGTEQPYNNEYWDLKDEGIYVDVVSGEPLFSSKDKYDSKTGWPSFTKPLVPGNMIEKTDYLLGYQRTEVRSKHGDSHLGHVFNDGPQPLGLRYCMNSAALRFIPKDMLREYGYGEFESLF